jgi:SH3-like domain-containing protein
VFVCAFYVNYLDNRFGTGVLIDRQSVVLQQPGENASPVSTAYEGYTLRVDFKKSEESDNWSYVRLENGMYGWVENSAIKVF